MADVAAPPPGFGPAEPIAEDSATSPPPGFGPAEPLPEEARVTNRFNRPSYEKPEGQVPMLRGVFPGSGMLMEEFGPVSRTDRIKSAGLPNEGVRTGIRFNTSFGRDPLEAYTLALQQEFPDVDPEELDVHQNPDFGIVYRNPETGQYDVVDPEGEGFLGNAQEAMTEIAENSPYIAQTVASLAAGLGAAAGTAKTGPVAIVAGLGAEGVTDFATEFGRLLYGKEVGVIPEDVSATELAADAAITSGIGTLIGASIPGAIAIRNKVKRTLSGIPNIDADEWERMVLRRLGGNGRQGDIPAEAQPGMTSGQLAALEAQEEGGGGTVGEYAPVLIRREEDALSAAADFPEYSAGMRAARQQQQQSQADYVARQQPDDKGPYLPSDAPDGQVPEAARALRQSVEQERSDATTRRTRVRDLIDTRLRASIEGAEGATTDTAGTGRSVRTGLEQAQENASQRLSSAYENMRAQTADMEPVTLTNLQSVAEENARLIDNDILPSLSGNDRTLMSEILDRTQREGNQFKTYNAEQISRALSQLKEQRRAIVDGTPKYRQISRLIQALEADRERLFKKNGQMPLFNRIKGLEEEYEDYATTYTRSVVSDVVGMDGRLHNLDSTQVYQRLKQNQDQALRVAQALRAEGGDEGQAGLLNMRRAIRGEWYDNFGKRFDDLGDQAASDDLVREHRRWVEQNEGMLRAFFTPEQYEAFANQPQVLARRTRQTNEAYDGIIRQIDDMIGGEGNLQGLLDKPDSYLNFIKSPTNSRAIYERLELLSERGGATGIAAEQLLGRMRAKARQVLVGDFVVNGRVNFDRMVARLSGEGEQGEKWARAVRTWVGDEYADNLLNYANIMQRMQRSYDSMTGGDRKASAAIWLTRGLVARPLSRAGLLFTAGLTGGRQNALRVAAELTKDPRRLGEFLRATRQGNEGAVIKAVFGDEAYDLYQDIQNNPKAYETDEQFPGYPISEEGADQPTSAPAPAPEQDGGGGGGMDAPLPPPVEPPAQDVPSQPAAPPQQQQRGALQQAAPTRTASGDALLRQMTRPGPEGGMRPMGVLAALSGPNSR